MIDTTGEGESQKMQAKASKERTLQEYYNDCAFDSGVTSFTDMMQSQFTQQNMFILPSSSMDESSFNFYNRGKELWKESADLRDNLEDKFRQQLEKSDLLQGFQVSADVNSGFGSLANIMTVEYVKDEAPKAPVFLYALEGANPYKKKAEDVKFNLFKLNKCLWLGEMLPNFDIVVPFNSLYMQQTYAENPLVTRFLSKLDARRSVYHRSALQSLVQNSVTQRSILPNRGEVFRDSSGKPALSMRDLASSVLYTDKANIALPYLQFPMWKKTETRWSENLQIEDLCKDENFLSFNPTNPLKNGPLRHSFFFNGMDVMRSAEREAADPLSDHVNKLIRTKQ